MASGRKTTQGLPAPSGQWGHDPATDLWYPIVTDPDGSVHISQPVDVNVIDPLPMPVTLPENEADAFRRRRVSQPIALFDSQMQADTQPLLWEDIIGVGGSITHLPNSAAARLRVPTTSGVVVARQQRQYNRYQPGKGQLIIATGILGAPKANVRRRIGYFDVQNGVFFEQTAAALSVVIRSFTSGAAVDTAIPQASWNMDKLDGTGPSGITLDQTKLQIFVWDFEWLSGGQVRFGFFFAGQPVYCHAFEHVNVLDDPYMTTPNLPMRYEIGNTGTAASESDLIQICTVVISEGGTENELSYPFSADNGISAISVTTRRPVLSIRPAATFNGIVNRAQIQPLLVQALVGGNNALIEVVYGGTLTGASFAAVNASSVTERDVAATAISGGIVIATLYVPAGAGVVRNVSDATLSSKLPLVVDAAGANPINLSVVATSFTGTATVTAALEWKELR